MLDKNADMIIETLVNNRFEAFYVGGCVRTVVHNSEHNDSLPIKDFDIVTNASYDDMAKMFKYIEDRGESFNVAVVKMNGEEYEVARYRGETYPEGGSTRPDEVFNVDTLEEDLLRRDFKMNGLVINKDGLIIDHVGGLDDIKNKVVSTIGDPNKRFSEDPLRILRAIRFVSQLGYNIEEYTLEAMIKNIHLVSTIPHSRIEGEFSKIIKSKHSKKALVLLREIHQISGQITFKNTILNKKVSLLPSVFSLSLGEFNEVVEGVDNCSDSLEFFHHLYRYYFNEDLVEEELTNMQLTTNEIITNIKLLVRNKSLLAHLNQSRESLLKFVREIKGQNEREVFNKFLEIYTKAYKNINFDNLKTIKCSLFIKELPYNGRDVMNEGLKMGYNIQGKMVGEILELGREKSVLGEKYDLDHILGLIKNRLDVI